MSGWKQTRTRLMGLSPCERAIRRLIPLMHHIAWDLARQYNQSHDEMYSCCLEGLWNACLRIDSTSYDQRFTNYAARWARGKALQWIAEQTLLAHMRNYGADRKSVLRFTDLVKEDDRPFDAQGEDSLDPFLLPTLIPTMRNVLDEPEKQVLLARYWQELSQDEAGQLLGMSDAWVSDVETRAIGKLRDSFGATESQSLSRVEKTVRIPSKSLMTSDNKKICKLCRIPKELHEFRKMRGKPTNDCLDCHRERGRNDARRKTAAKREGHAAGRHCSRRRLCLAYPELGEPAKLARGNSGPLCEQCRRAKRPTILSNLY